MRKRFSVLALFFILILFSARQVNAASATIIPSPNIGNFDKTFTINLVIDGKGDKFNAAQANVSISPYLTVKDLTLGDCNFSFLKTPNIQNPSFAGVIISTYSTKCTVYTLTLVPNAKGKASIILSKASIKHYGDAQEMLSSAYDGTYSLTGTDTTEVLHNSQQQNKPNKGLYNLNLNIYSSGTSPVTNASVTLSSVSTKNLKQASTDNKGIATFTNLQAGVYDAVVTKGFSKTGETIVNVSGPNHVITLGIDLSAQKNNPLMKLGSIVTYITTNPIILVGILIAGIILGIGIALLLIKLLEKRKKKHHISP